MARIKSAWEIALEKTQDIEIDENKYRSDKLEKEGKALAGSYLNNTDKSLDEVVAKYASYSDEDRKCVRDGMLSTVFSNVSLPTDEMYELRFNRTCDLMNVITQGDAQAMGLMQQIGGFFKQYIDCKKDFITRMEAQIRQAMETNPESVNKQQYTQIIDQNIRKMDSQYSGALENTKEALKQLLGL